MNLHTLTAIKTRSNSILSKFSCPSFLTICLYLTTEDERDLSFDFRNYCDVIVPEYAPRFAQPTPRAAI